MATSTAGKVYAEGLYRASLRQGQTEPVGRELETLEQALSGDRRLRDFLGTPAVPAAAKREALRRSLTGRVGPTFLNFLLVLVRKRRLGALGEIQREYRKLLDADARLIRGECVSAREVPGPVRQRLEEVLSGHWRGRVVLGFRVEPDLLGGARIQVGDCLLDWSFKSRLANLRRQLLAARF